VSRVHVIAGAASASESSPSFQNVPATVARLEPEADLEGDPEAGDPLVSFRDSQQQAAADFQTRIRQSQTAVRSGGGGGKLQPQKKARKPKPKKQTVSAASDEEQQGMYLGTRPHGGEQSLTDGSDVSKRLDDGLLPRSGGSGKAAAAHAVSSVNALTATAADPVEGLSGAAGALASRSSTTADGKDVDPAAGAQRGDRSESDTDGSGGRSAVDPGGGIDWSADPPVAAAAADSIQRRAGATHATRKCHGVPKCSAPA